MQVNRNTWRGVYDVKGLGGDIAYNGNAGGEILLYYLTRYAIRKKTNNRGESGAGNLFLIQRWTESLDTLSRCQAETQRCKKSTRLSGRNFKQSLRAGR